MKLSLELNENQIESIKEIMKMIFDIKITIIKIKMRQMQKLYFKSKKVYLDFWVKRDYQIQVCTFANPLKQQVTRFVKRA